MVTQVNTTLAGMGKRRIVAWEFNDIVEPIDETDYQVIDEYLETEDDDDYDPDDPRRAEFNELAERIVRELLIGRRHTEHEGERDLVLMRTVETAERPGLSGYYSYHPPWWDLELQTWQERFRPLQTEALDLVVPAGPHPLPLSQVAKTMKRIALEEFAPGQKEKVRFPFDVTSYGSPISRWVTLRGPEPQTNLFEPAVPGSGTHRIQRLMELAEELRSRSECTQMEALSFLLCDVPLYRQTLYAHGDLREGQPYIDIRVNSLDVPAEVVAAAYKDERASLGVARARAVPRRSKWPAIIFEFVEARTPPQGKRDWVALFKAFKSNPAHQACDAVKNNNQRSFVQTFFREQRRRGAPASGRALTPDR